MRFVFLDIDGVIATEATYDKWRQEQWDPSREDLLLDNACCARVQKLCAEAKAEIVISSDWKDIYKFSDLVARLQRAGITAPVIGCIGRGHRGKAIATWMAEHGVTDENVVILEDKRDVAPNKHRQVKTLFAGKRAGFQQVHLRKALSLWGLSV